MDFWDNFYAHNKGLKVFLPYKKNSGQLDLWGMNSKIILGGGGQEEPCPVGTSRFNRQKKLQSETIKIQTEEDEHLKKIYLVTTAEVENKSTGFLHFY